MADEMDVPEDDKGGFGNPPKAHQFKPGRSGNPKGRPKGPGNLLKLIAKHAAKKVTVIEGGVEKKMAKMDVVISAMFNKAAKGDVPAARLIASMVQAAAQLSGSDESGYSDEDLMAILEEANWQAGLVKLAQEQESDDF
ncbi:DUF5681 domain-containing protein [Defluviimonas aestuarii]|uniref:DUF5681 domain-containing protein n=1 Tax=Albidovulum aestuarii TaxID=1130726 RepID=UPI00249A2416|nr:DUF5681 domain-containing protein [Defluviimonas aestuarii]MDI3338875.1 DUF5681 domain-containing protein [Defluviimonas aestuarii]